MGVARHLGELPIYATHIEKWKDFSWIIPRTAGYRWQLPSMVERDQLDMRGVLFRLRPAGHDRSSLLHMFWAYESAGWKLWGLSPVPSE